MDVIQEFLNSPLCQIVILVVVAIFFGKNPELINRILEILKIQKPKVDEPTLKIASIENDEIYNNSIDNVDAFVAVNSLITFFQKKGEGGQEGLVATKEVGKHLFN